MKALILNNEVIQIEEEPFEVHPSMIWVDVPEDLPVRVLWRYHDGVFLPPLPRPPGSGGKGGSAIGGDINIGGKGGDGLVGGDGGHGIGEGVNIGGQGGAGLTKVSDDKDINWTKVGALITLAGLLLAILTFIIGLV